MRFDRVDIIRRHILAVSSSGRTALCSYVCLQMPTGLALGRRAVCIGLPSHATCVPALDVFLAYSRMCVFCLPMLHALPSFAPACWLCRAKAGNTEEEDKVI